MSSTLVEPIRTATTRTPTLAQAEPVPAQSSINPAVAAAEERRWFVMLGIPFVISAVFFALAIGTGWRFFMAPAMVLGPGLIIFGFVYLALTSDTNGSE